jgi:putative PIN family toxin of toxin-antitoxin system
LLSTLFAEPLLKELIEVTSRPQFHQKIQPQRRDRLVRLIKDKATAVQLPSEIPAICSDPDDDMYLICAKIAKADFIVTGDPHLLRLGEYKGVKTITAAKFLKILLKLKK